MEPVHGGTVDDTGELSSSESEGISDWGEAESQVKVLSGLAQEEVKELVRGIEVAGLLGFGSNLSENAVELVLSEELRNPTRGKNIVDVHEELVVGDLSVGQDEQELSTSNTGFEVHILNVGLKIVHAVVGSHNNADHIIAEDERRKLGKRLLS